MTPTPLPALARAAAAGLLGACVLAASGSAQQTPPDDGPERLHDRAHGPVAAEAHLHPVAARAVLGAAGLERARRMGPRTQRELARLIHHFDAHWGPVLGDLRALEGPVAGRDLGALFEKRRQVHRAAFAYRRAAERVARGGRARPARLPVPADGRRSGHRHRHGHGHVHGHDAFGAWLEQAGGRLHVRLGPGGGR